MAQRTAALEAGRTLYGQVVDLGIVAQRRRVGRRGGAVDRLHPGAHRRRHVHQAGVVGHHLLAIRQQVHGIGQACLAAQVVDAGKPRGDGVARLGILGASQHPHLEAIGHQGRGQGVEMCQRPLLGRAVLGPGHHADGRARGEPQPLAQRRLVAGIHLEPGLGNREVPRGRLIGGQAQGDETLHRLVQHALVEAAPLVEQRIALFAVEADPVRDSRQERHQRRLPGARQDDGAVEAAAQRAGHGAPRRPAELAVLDVQGDRLIHLRHALEDR